MGFVVKRPYPAMPTHISVPALQCSGDLGSGHCTMSRASASYNRICYSVGKMGQAPLQGSHAAVTTPKPTVRYYRGFSLFRWRAR